MNLAELTPEEIEELEHISDEIRKGHPVSFMDGLAAIGYQTALEEQRKGNRRWWEFWKWI